jgi:hypothetical protein
MPAAQNSDKKSAANALKSAGKNGAHEAPSIPTEVDDGKKQMQELFVETKTSTRTSSSSFGPR